MNPGPSPSLPERPGLPEDERQRRRRELGLIVAAAIVFGVFAAVEIRLASFGGESLAASLVSFLVINLNLLLLVLLVFLVTRNVVKLLMERRRGVFGSRLGTRLVLAFVGLTLAPSFLLFLVAQGFLNAAIDTWFNVRVESALRGSVEVSQSYYQLAANQAFHFARRIAAEAGDAKGPGAGRPAEMGRWLEDRRTTFGLGAVELWGVGGDLRARQAGDGAPVGDDLPAEAWTELRAGREAAVTQRRGSLDLVRVAVPVTGPGGAWNGAVVVDFPVPRSVSRDAAQTSRTYRDYRQLAGMRQPIKNGYILSLSLVTLVVVFSAVWVGIRQARSITGPLQLLEKGTREVAQGNWAHRIEVDADRETAVLVDSFNRMTGDLQRIHSELVERRNYVESVLANIGAGVVSVDSEGRVTTLNPAAERLLGVRLDVARGRGWSEVLARGDLARLGELLAAVRQDPVREHQAQVKLVGGEAIVTILATATALRREDGAVGGLLLFLEDVTHLLRVQRMEAWREVARRLAHEIKNPLTPIRLSAQRIQRRYGTRIPGDDREVFEECTSTIVRQVDELKRLVDEFSQFARLPAVVPSSRDLNPVVEEAVALFRQAHPEVSFEFAAGEDLPAIEIDHDAVKRVVINLLDNALAACEGTGESPRIGVSTSLLPSRHAVRLEIRDNGCGVSPQVKQRMFEPYFSTKREGTGLGLAIVASIVSDHQAYVRVVDHPPRGCRFLIDFPLGQATPAAALAARVSREESA